MSAPNTLSNRIVWADVPVTDLDRATAFYAAVLGIEIHRESYEGTAFAVFSHDEGNGGCLVPAGGSVGQPSPDHGPLVYFNVNGRIRDAVAKATEHGGRVVQDVHGIGPHGVRAIVIDSEGNRVALHAESDG